MDSPFTYNGGKEERHPSLRWLLPGIVVSFIAGLLLGPILSLSHFTCFALFLSLVFLYGLSIWKESGHLLKAFPFLVFFFTGVLHGSLIKQTPLPPDHIVHLIGKEKRYLEAIVAEAPEILPDRTRILLDVKGVIQDGIIRSAKGKLLLVIGEPVHSLHYGDRIRLRTSLKGPKNFNNPGQFDYVEWLRRRGIYAKAYVKDARGIIIMRRNEGNPILCSIEAWRRKMESAMEGAVSSPSKEILKALVLGKKGEITDEIRDLFSFTGTAHLLAISGFHMGLVVLFSFTLIKGIIRQLPFILMRWNRERIAAILSLFPLLGYGTIAGMGIATIRSVIMVVVVFLSLFIGRKLEVVNALAIAALMILLFSPEAIYEVSFQLSFVAVLSICTMVPIIFSKLRGENNFKEKARPSISSRLWTGFILLFLSSLSAIIGTAPITAYHFNQVSHVGIFTNIISIPLVGYGILPLALMGSFFSLFSEPISFILLKCSSVFVELLVDFMRLANSIPFSFTFIVTPYIWEIVLFYSAAILWIWGMKWPRLRLSFILPLLILLFSILIDHFSPRFTSSLKICFLSVGDGSSVLVQFPKGKRMLIDGGGTYDERFDVGRKVVAPFLWRMRIHRIDELVLTHPHPDHMNGLKFIARHFSIGRLWTNGERGNTRSFKEFEAIIMERNIPVRIMGKGDEEPIGGARVVVLHPPKGIPFHEGSKWSSWINNNSLTLKIDFGNHSFLLPSDIEKEAEEHLLKSGRIKSLVLHVPHHGSSSSTTETFLEGVSPKVAVISAGGRLGLPSPKVLERLADRGIQVFRTDTHGAVIFETDGICMKSWSFLPPLKKEDGEISMGPDEG